MNSDQNIFLKALEKIEKIRNRVKPVVYLATLIFFVISGGAAAFYYFSSERDTHINKIRQLEKENERLKSLINVDTASTEDDNSNRETTFSLDSVATIIGNLKNENAQLKLTVRKLNRKNAKLSSDYDSIKNEQSVLNYINKLEGKKEDLLYEIKDLNSELADIKEDAAYQKQRCLSAKETERENLILKECSKARQDSVLIQAKVNDLELAQQRLKSLNNQISELHSRF